MDLVAHYFVVNLPSHDYLCVDALLRIRCRVVLKGKYRVRTLPVRAGHEEQVDLGSQCADTISDVSPVRSSEDPDIIDTE